jgi:hypothetical protein
MLIGCSLNKLFPTKDNEGLLIETRLASGHVYYQRNNIKVVTAATLQLKETMRTDLLAAL